ncbi:MAG: hypothetical protein AAFP82_07030, partial [Bacteroidota bacterium]
LEAKKLSIIEQILAIEEEQVLDAILSELAKAKVTDRLDVLQEEEVSYQAAQNDVDATEKEGLEEEETNDSISKYITAIEPVLDLEKIKKEQGFINADKEKINALIIEANIEEPIEVLLADLD